jgi:transketolase
MIACRTVIAKGIARLQGQRGGHSARLHPEDAQVARRDLQWDAPEFEIPDAILSSWRAAGTRSKDEFDRWNQRLASLPQDQRDEIRRIMRGELPASCLDCWRSSRPTLLRIECRNSAFNAQESLAMRLRS